jgi:hypothetical protein
MSLSNFSRVSVNETPCKTSGNTKYFQQPWWGGGVGQLGVNWPKYVLEMESLYEFDEMIDSSLPPVTYTYMGHTLKNFLKHISPIKKTQRMAFKKNA